MSETTILNYELGYMPIAYDKAKRLAKALEIDEKLLFDDYCRFLDYPFQLRCKELRSELGLTYGTLECAAVRPGREPFQKFAAFITSQGKEVVLPFAVFQLAFSVFPRNGRLKSQSKQLGAFLRRTAPFNK